MGRHRDHAEGYYAHMFVWDAQNTFSYVSAEETTADFAKWMFEHGKSVSQVAPVARYKDADYVTFKDDKHGRICVGFPEWPHTSAAAISRSRPA